MPAGCCPVGSRIATVSRSVSPSLVRVLFWAGCLIATQFAAPVWAAETSGPSWAEKMVSDRDVDFGTVARGEDVSRKIKITNVYQETMTLAEVSVASPDFEVSVDKHEILSRQASFLTIRAKTQDIGDSSSATVTLKMTFDGTNYKSVQIPVSVQISKTEVAAATRPALKACSPPVVVRARTWPDDPVSHAARKGL